MEAFEFTIIASGLDPDAADFEDRFFEAGCDDATVSWQKGAIILDFTREAESFNAAIQSAIDMVRAAGAQVERATCARLVVLKVVNPEEAEIVYDGPGEPAWAAAGGIQKNGQRTLSLSTLKRLNSN